MRPELFEGELKLAGIRHAAPAPGEGFRHLAAAADSLRRVREPLQSPVAVEDLDRVGAEFFDRKPDPGPAVPERELHVDETVAAVLRLAADLARAGRNPKRLADQFARSARAGLRVEKRDHAQQAMRIAIPGDAERPVAPDDDMPAAAFRLRAPVGAVGVQARPGASLATSRERSRSAVSTASKSMSASLPGIRSAAGASIRPAARRPGSRAPRGACEAP